MLYLIEALREKALSGAKKKTPNIRWVLFMPLSAKRSRAFASGFIASTGRRPRLT